MAKENRKKYLEEITHVTRISPYSLHESSFLKGEGPALYLHLHPEMEFFYLEKGELSFWIEEICCELKEGEAVFIPSNLLHTAFAVSKEGRFRALVFAPEYLAASMERMHFQKYVSPILQDSIGNVIHLKEETIWQSEAIALLKRLFEGAEAMATPELLISGYLLVIWQYLYQYHFGKLPKTPKKGRMTKQIEAVAAYIRAHYQEEFSLALLAGVGHMSEGQLCRSFRQHTGATPFTYLKRYRILKSCVYLAETDKKISEICMLCGFNNISYFNREFLKIMKATPSEYRRQSIEFAESGKNLLTSAKNPTILTT